MACALTVSYRRIEDIRSLGNQVHFYVLVMVTTPRYLRNSPTVMQEQNKPFPINGIVWQRQRIL